MFCLHDSHLVDQVQATEWHTQLARPASQSKRLHPCLTLIAEMYCVHQTYCNNYSTVLVPKLYGCLTDTLQHVNKRHAQDCTDCLDFLHSNQG